MTKEQWIEKEVAEKEKTMKLDAHNKSTLRAVLGKEHDFWEKEAVRLDSHTGHDDQ
jgi:hypothetical protein